MPNQWQTPVQGISNGQVVDRLGGVSGLARTQVAHAENSDQAGIVRSHSTVSGGSVQYRGSSVGTSTQ